MYCSLKSCSSWHLGEWGVRIGVKWFSTGSEMSLLFLKCLHSLEDSSFSSSQQVLWCTEYDATNWATGELSKFWKAHRSLNSLLNQMDLIWLVLFHKIVMFCLRLRKAMRYKPCKKFVEFWTESQWKTEENWPWRVWSYRSELWLLITPSCLVWWNCSALYLLLCAFLWDNINEDHNWPFPENYLQEQWRRKQPQTFLSQPLVSFSLLLYPILSSLVPYHQLKISQYNFTQCFA